MYKLNKKNINHTNNFIRSTLHKLSLKSVIINSISASIIIIFLLLVFEIIFYFLVTKQDIIKYLKHIDKKLPIQYIAIEELLINVLDNTPSQNKNNTSQNNNTPSQNNNIPDVIKNIMVHKNEDNSEVNVFFTKLYRDKLIDLFNNSVDELIAVDFNQFNTNTYKRYIELSLYVGLYVIIVIAFHYLYKNTIEWDKITLILLFSYTLIILCEVFFYYKVYSKVRLINDNKLINNIIVNMKN